MASEAPGAPKCPRCRRSDGTATSAMGVAEWRRGRWRWCSDPEIVGADFRCACGETYPAPRPERESR